MASLFLVSYLYFFFCPSLLLLVSLFFFLSVKTSMVKKQSSCASSSSSSLPKSYPLIGSTLAILENQHRRIQWISDILRACPSATFVLHSWFGNRVVFTGNPAVVRHILKSHFHNYQKGDVLRVSLTDFLGNGIFNSGGDVWKYQRQLSSHEFSTKSLRKFVEIVVDTELSDRLVPILCMAEKNGLVLDFQDVLERFGFDNICKIAFGYDPAYLSPSFPNEKYATSFEECVRISSGRFNCLFPIIWKVKKFLDIGSEKKLRIAINEVRGFAKKMIEEKKRELKEKATLESVDLLSRFLSSGHSDENFVTDIIISFILAGRDTTSAALTWFFWLISKHPDVEEKILEEINGKNEASTVYEGVKEMEYTHAALCETMRLYPPVPVDTKEAMNDDVLPDGTVVKKGTTIKYHPYAMGRLEVLWGADWAEFRPERWLEKKSTAEFPCGKWRFVGRDSFTYPVFQAGPRICLGKEMAFLQMKRVVAGVMRQFRVVPVMKEGEEPELAHFLTGKMRGGLPVKIEERGV